MRRRVWSRRLAALTAVTTTTVLGIGGMAGIAWAVDTDPPAAPLAPDLVVTSDSGALSTDNVTNDATPSFYVGGVESDSTVTLYANGDVVGTAAVGSGMSGVSVTASTLTDGGYEVRATDTDAAGNTGPLSSAMAPNLIIDTTAPAAPTAPDLQAASDTGASSTDNVTDVTTPTFDVGGVESYSTVTLYANGDVVGTADVGPETSVSITASSLADGGYEIRASDTDLAGNPGPTSAAMAPNLVIETVVPPEPVVGIGESLQPSTSDPFFTGGQYMWGIDVWPGIEPVEDVPLTVTFTWGDGSSSTVVTTDPDASVWCDTGGSGACNVWASHVYTAQGLYTVDVAATQPGAEGASMGAELVVYDRMLGGTIKGSGTVEARSGGMYQQGFTSGTATFQLTAKRRAGTAATDASLVVSVPSMVADYTGATGMTFTSHTATRPLYVQKLARNSYEVFLERIYGTVTNSAGSAGTALATFHAIITKGQPTLVRISIWNTSAGYTYMDTAAPADTTYLSIATADRLLTGSLKIG